MTQVFGQARRVTGRRIALIGLAAGLAAGAIGPLQAHEWASHEKPQIAAPVTYTDAAVLPHSGPSAPVVPEPTSGYSAPRLVRTPAERATALAALEQSKAASTSAIIPEKAPGGTPDKATATAKGELLETGIASTYGTGDGFQGNLTACGQVFDTHIPQVAHKTLPCGTLVRVEDAETGKSVTVEVTDRGPYSPGRVVDLSWAAFQVLDPTAPGLRPVNVYRVS